jgi:NADPH:quinone reductase-like Zn-dependent oxidoreductase
MRAFAVSRFGETPAIQQLPIPEENNAMLVSVNFAGVNPIDYKLVERLIPSSAYPFVLGADFSGFVERIPAGYSDFRVGDRIFGMARKRGSYAEYTSLVVEGGPLPVAKIPDGVTAEQAAALPIPGITAFGSLDLLQVKSSQTLVVMGASGAVGGYAVQMARSQGVRVIGTVRGDADQARQLGAAEVYDTASLDVIDAIHNAHPEGVDAILDLVNGPGAIKRDTEILKSGGGLVSTIYAADEKWFAERQIKAHNIAGNSNPFATPQGLAQLVQLLAAGTITSRVQAIVELNAASEILEKLKKGGLRGKALIRVS